MSGFQEGWIATPKEITSVRPAITSFIQSIGAGGVVGSRESVEGVIVDCLVRKMELKDMKDKLEKYIPGKASKLIDVIIGDVNQSRSQLKRKGDSNGDDHHDNGHRHHGDRYDKKQKANDTDSPSRRRGGDDRDYRDRQYYDDRDHRDRYRDERDSRDRYDRDSRDTRDRHYYDDRDKRYSDSRDTRDSRDRHDDRYRNERDNINSDKQKQTPSKADEVFTTKPTESKREVFTTNLNPPITPQTTTAIPITQPITPSPSQQQPQQHGSVPVSTPTPKDTNKIQELKARLLASQNQLKQAEQELNQVGVIAPQTTITTTTTPTIQDQEMKDIDNQKENEQVIEQEEEEEEVDKNSPFYDPRLSHGPRKKKTVESFNLVTKPGKFTKKADKLRLQLFKEELTQKEQNTKNVLSKAIMTMDSVPELEWWDKDLFEDTCTSYQPFMQGTLKENTNNQEKINMLKENDHWSFVEHPVIIHAPLNTAPLPTLQIVPPLKERKKIRRQRREEERRLRDERIMSGEEAPPPDRVKMGTVMRILSTKAVQDPTAVINQVLRDQEARIEANIQKNLEKKLTPEQRREKNEQKILVDADRELRCALFKVGDISHPLFLSKITHTVKQFMITGCIIMTAQFSLLIVEGGVKAVHNIRKLMTRRIDWANPPPITQKQPKKDDEPGSISNEENAIMLLKDQRSRDPALKDQVNYCQVVWEGPIQKAHFKFFKREVCESDALARKYLQEHAVLHYWDMTKNHISY